MTRVILLLAIEIALPLSAGLSTAQDGPDLLPPPEGETIESVIAEVIATERREVRSGPAYIVVREKTEMSPMPILSVYKKIAGLGYFHLPPAYLKSEFCERVGEGVSTMCPGGEDGRWLQALAVHTFGLAVIAELHYPGAGGVVARTGEEILTDMQQRDLEDYQAVLDASADLRAHRAALRRLITEADRFGTAEMDGNEYWYLSARGLNLRQGPGPSGFSFEGTVVLDRAELWIEKETHRIARFRFTGEGSEDASISLTHTESEDDEEYIASLSINTITIDQLRQEFYPLRGSTFNIAHRKFNTMSIKLQTNESRIIDLLRSIGRARNNYTELFQSGDITREQWDRSNERLEARAVFWERALQLSREPFEQNVQVFVECAVPADNVTTVVANLATLARDAVDPAECG